MDSIPTKLEFKFQITDFNIDNIEKDWQLILRIVADFEILINGKVFFNEPQFPVVEFAMQAAAWSRNVKENFDYESMESDESPLIWFNSKNDNYTVGSPWQKYEERNPIEREVLQTSLNNFIEALRKELVSDYEIDISHLINGKHR